MITDGDIKKLKTVFATKEDLKQFATKEDLDESEARTAFGFSDVQSQISDLKKGQIDLTEKVDDLSGRVDQLSGRVDQLSEKVTDLSGEVKEISQQMHGMEKNIIRAINETKDKQDDQEVRITKLERATFSN